MAVYYYKGDKILAPFKIISNRPTFASDTVSLKHIRVAQEAQRWELSFNTLTKENAANSFLGILEDMEERGQMIMPQFPEVAKATTASGNFGVETSVASNTSTLQINTDLGSGFLPKGSFIKFSNHDKVYVTRNDLDVDSATPQELNIYPALTSNLSAFTEIEYGSNCIISYYRDINNIQGITFTDGVLADQGTVTLIEAL